jgi:ABC-type multidrug transport system permease subunit
MVLFFHLFATSWGQWVGALSKDAGIAAVIMPFMVIMCELFNGVLRPQSQMPVVWKYTMYYVAPFTYWIGGVLSSVMAGTKVVCSEADLSFFNAPPGQTCGEYAASWLENATGYLSEPEATGSCGYCAYSVADDYLAGLNLDGSKTWKYFGIFLAFVMSNYCLVVGIMWFYTWRKFGGKNGKATEVL